MKEIYIRCTSTFSLFLHSKANTGRAIQIDSDRPRFVTQTYSGHSHIDLVLLAFWRLELRELQDSIYKYSWLDGAHIILPEMAVWEVSYLEPSLGSEIDLEIIMRTIFYSGSANRRIKSKLPYVHFTSFEI